MVKICPNLKEAQTLFFDKKSYKHFAIATTYLDPTSAKRGIEVCIITWYAVSEPEWSLSYKRVYGLPFKAGPGPIFRSYSMEKRPVVLSFFKDWLNHYCTIHNSRVWLYGKI